MEKKIYLKITLITVVILFFFYVAYSFFLAPTKIALVNFPAYQVANIKQANKSFFIEIDEVFPEEAASLTRYDAILLFVPGLRLSKEEHAAINKARDKGAFIYNSFFRSSVARNSPIDSLQQKELRDYFSNRSTKNYRNLLYYIRKNFDRNKIFSLEVNKPEILPSEMFYHLDKDQFFLSEVELTDFLKSKKQYKEGAPRIAFCSGSISPLEGNKRYLDNIISAFTDEGYNVYPICSGSSKRLKFLKQVNPQAVIYMPMGRLAGDSAVDWLIQKNIPLFCPFPMLQTHEKWISDTKGQSGGGLTARIVLAEIDGGIVPLAISTENKHGDLYSFDTEKERLETFVGNVKNYLSLKIKQNADKRVAVIYFKGPGQTSLKASGMEVIPSLYNLLKSLREEGYTVKNLPQNIEDFEEKLQFQGTFQKPRAQGAIERYLKQAKPLWIGNSTYKKWVAEQIVPQKYHEVVEKYGAFPGSYMSRGDSLAIPYLDFGNIVLLPQPRPAFGGDDFKIVHGSKDPPPHSYIAPYLWIQKGFKADALIHFGTHGNLEFIPGKQTALSQRDWSDCLIGNIPHFYYYSTGNVGEGIIAKRRSHAVLVSHLTPPFKESKTRKGFQKLFQEIDTYHNAPETLKEKAALQVKKTAISMGLHKDLQLNGEIHIPYSHADIDYIENFAEEISNEKITGRLYTLGEYYKPDDIATTTVAISADPLAYNIAKIDMLRGKIDKQQYESTNYLSRNYLLPVKTQIKKILRNNRLNLASFLKLASLSQQDINEAHRIDSLLQIASKIRRRSREKPKTKAITLPTKEQKYFSETVLEIEKAACNILKYQELLKTSPEKELRSLHNGLNGGYVAPSPGGDAVRTPNVLPTGRNLYAINAEAIPTASAWQVGKMLAANTLKQYRKKYNKFPRKVSYTFWSGEFIASEGATLGQALYMLGVEPVRDQMNRVVDLRLIPSKELGRPRIDIVTQVSGQLRDLAASRLILLTKAVALASSAENDIFPNHVKEGTQKAEKAMLEKGFTLANARHLSTMRIFGGLGGRYGTGVMKLVEKGDAWEDTNEIATVYLNNMGAMYGNDKEWGDFAKGLFGIVLQDTDIVIQPRQNNTWGALSLDHMYEFMGGINLSISKITGKTPDTYLADYRNRNYNRIQELREAIGVESRTTLLNESYIKEKMRGAASSAQTIAKTIRNTYGWNVMKDNVIDDELWDRLFEVYVEDCYRIGVHDFFEKQNPYALQEITAVMLETARKELWEASNDQLQKITDLYIWLVTKYGSSGSDFTDNQKLEDFIKKHIKDESKSILYQENLDILRKKTSSDDAIFLEKEILKEETVERKKDLQNLIIAIGIVLLLFVIIIAGKHRKI